MKRNSEIGEKSINEEQTQVLREGLCLVIIGFNLVISTTPLMLDFTTQKKLLDPILKDPRNNVCADCNSIAPTWASLDFGVFVCSNCSGAHRGLGPTITRVRSANLDKWQQEWLSNMRLGNSDINLYWQHDPQHYQRKPNSNSSLNEIARYVFQKYVKRKFVKDKSEVDPLTQYKQGSYKPNAHHSKTIAAKKVQPGAPTLPKHVQPAKPVQISKKTDFDLINFDFEAPQSVQAKKSEPTPAVHSKKDINLFEDQQFTQYAQAGSTKSEDDRKHQGDLISFDSLLSSQQQPQPPQQYHQMPTNQNSAHWNFNNPTQLSYNQLRGHNMQQHHAYNPHNHNMVYHNQYNQQHIQHYNKHNFSSLPHTNPTPSYNLGSFW